MGLLIQGILNKKNSFWVNVTKIKPLINIHQSADIMLPKYNTFLGTKSFSGNKNILIFYNGQYLYKKENS